MSALELSVDAWLSILDSWRRMTNHKTALGNRACCIFEDYRYNLQDIYKCLKMKDYPNLNKYSN